MLQERPLPLLFMHLLFRITYAECFTKYERDGTCFCSCDSSVESSYLSTISSVEALILCSMRCSQKSSCVAYNFFTASNQCQLFNKTGNCFRVVPNCHHYFKLTSNVNLALSRSLLITVDNFLLAFYVNGAAVDVPLYFRNAGDWTKTDRYTLAGDVIVLAIKPRNSGGAGRLIAKSSDDYILTNSTWKCTNNSYDGWYEVDYDDSFWPGAVVKRREKNSAHAMLVFMPALWITDSTDSVFDVVLG
ncbi:hypothetical protein HELRODRAFT_160759 [Helobdella robusta]|uniref:Apple domain-containing protein n=1 Tax=Helobdella robusta TaxID=6412 RepID=T1EQP4_HELRO|nr:hypothetical protein HELRODRAFT_160759 [Helobdella robusta]ESO06576.1 hypothetical protein HELRODRAFT_160759 [Helobdella robusta]